MGQKKYKLTDQLNEQAQMSASSAHAQIMAQSVQNAHKRIVEERNAMDARGIERPLYVLVGEDHESVQHYIHHILLLDRLRADIDKLVLAYEQPYDLLSRFYRDDGKYEDNGHIINYLKDVDRQTAASVKLRFSEAENASAYFAHKVLAHNVISMMAQKPGWNFVGSDVSYDCDEIIESDDPNARRAMAAAGEDDCGLCHVSTAEGMHIRNAHMAMTLQDAAKKTGAAVVVQLCGIAHLNGDYEDNRPEWGLAQTLKKAGAHVLVLPLETESFVMPEVGLTQDSIEKCTLPIGPYAEYDPRFALSTKRNDNAQDNIMRSKAEEARYINQQLHLAGCAYLALDITQYEQLKKIYDADIDYLFRDVDVHFYGAPRLERKKLAPSL